MTHFKPCVVIEALAGAGKTYKLALRYLELLNKGAAPSEILATTFSVKAAGEIRDRVIDMVAGAVIDEEKRAELFLGVPEMEQTEENCVRLLRTITENLHRLQIGTIDSFFVKTARLFGDAMGFPRDWSILDELEEKSVMNKAVAEMLRNQDSETIASLLRLATGSTVVPVADSVGKIKRFAYDLIRQAGSEAWLGRQKLSVLSPTEIAKEITTLAVVQCENDRQLKKIADSVKRAEDGDWKGFLTKGLPKGMLDGTNIFNNEHIEPELTLALQPLFDHASAVIVNRIIDKNEGIVTLLKMFNTAWSVVKHREGLYKFEDITHYLKSFHILDDLNEVAFRIDSTIDHLLIDEFQDTSMPQWEILKPLIDEIYQAQSDRSLFFVGDPKQSLYGFRGGEPQLLRELPSRLGLDEPIRLPMSWRCSPPVLDAVNEVFKNAPSSALLIEHSEDGVTEWMRSFVIHESARPELQGCVKVHTTKGDADNNKPDLEYTIEKVTEIVRDIHMKNSNTSIGILVRKNTSQQIQRIVHALRTHEEYSVPASEHGGNPLTDSPQVTVVLSALVLADHPGDTTALFHVSTSPLGESLGLLPTSDRKDARVVSDSLRKRLVEEGYAKVVSDLSTPLYKNSSKRDQFRLWQLVELAELYSKDETLRPSEFVEFVKKKSVPDPATSKVQVMTVHASKGLGFDAVVVCDLDQSLWKPTKVLTKHDDPCEPPIRVSVSENKDFNLIIPEQEEMWEERYSKQVQEVMSLLYVAMTRAKQSLHLVIPPRPLGTSKSAKPSKAKSMDRLLRQTLGLEECLPPDEIVWQSELNSNTWQLQVSMEDQMDDPVQCGDICFADREGTIRVVAQSSPSSLEGGGKTLVSERFSGGKSTALDWGTIVHKWFEDFVWFEGLPSMDGLMSSAPREEAGRIGDERLHQVAQSFLRCLESKEIQTLLTKPEGNVSVYQEQDFAVRVAKGQSFSEVEMKELTDIQGSIDRLVVFYDDDNLPQSAEVIDWKTDSCAPDELDTKIAHYAPQLSSYRLAASRLLGIGQEKVTTKLVFTSIGKVVDMTNKT